MPYKCTNCGCVFDEFKTIETTYEAYNGVSNLFSNYHPLTLYVCPNCLDEEENWMEIDDEEDEDEEEDEDDGS